MLTFQKILTENSFFIGGGGVLNIEQRVFQHLGVAYYTQICNIHETLQYLKAIFIHNNLCHL